MLVILRVLICQFKTYLVQNSESRDILCWRGKAQGHDQKSTTTFLLQYVHGKEYRKLHICVNLTYIQQVYKRVALSRSIHDLLLLHPTTGSSSTPP